MCGLAGVLNFDGSPVGRETLRRMADSLRHRGPDAEGLYEDRAGTVGDPAVQVLSADARGQGGSPGMVCVRLKQA